MNNIKKVITAINLKLLGAVSALAFLMAVMSANNLCYYWFHQPKMPESVQLMKK